MSKAGSKKDTMIGVTRVKNAAILFAADCYLASISIHTQPLSDIPPANLSPQFQFLLLNARAESGKPISAEQFSCALVGAASGRERMTLDAALYDNWGTKLVSPASIGSG